MTRFSDYEEGLATGLRFGAGTASGDERSDD